MCVNADELAANEKVEDWGSPCPDDWESAVSSGMLEMYQLEEGGHKGLVQKSQSYYDKDIFIYVYIQ